MTNPKGDIILRPVKSNYHDGLSTLEYFISEHGGLQGLLRIPHCAPPSRAT